MTAQRIALRSLTAYLVTFAALRVITAIIHYDVLPNGPFRYVVATSGLHIHHLFWGIWLLMATGFVALATRSEVWHLRIATVFGIALGLTLDEFAVWLRLADARGVSGFIRAPPAHGDAVIGFVRMIASAART